jgi:hypothetical protein
VLLESEAPPAKQSWGKSCLVLSNRGVFPQFFHALQKFPEAQIQNGIPETSSKCSESQSLYQFAN